MIGADGPEFSWSSVGEGLIAAVDGRIAAVIYWAAEEAAWYWVPSDRPHEHFPVEHAIGRDDPALMFHAKEIVLAYLGGADPLEASERKWPPST